MTFNEWWTNTGFERATSLKNPMSTDSLMSLAGLSYQAGHVAGMAQTHNYMANDDTWPTELLFYNGQRIRIVETGEPGQPARHTLVIDRPGATLFTTDPQPPGEDIDVSSR